LRFVAQWSGDSLPLKRNIAGFEVVLASLKLRTNGTPKNYWETPGRYWEPVWELRQNGIKAPGWNEPEWTAEDATGNRGQHLGIHRPVLRFSATIYPTATNLEAAQVVGILPQVSLSNMTTNIVWWNITNKVDSTSIEALGWFPKGMHIFSEGAYVSNPPVRMGPTRGGAPSGWVGTGQRINPSRIKYWSGHYTPSPVIYLRVPSLGSTNRLAIRLRDENGKYWVAKPEPEGASAGIMPYLVELPSEMNSVVPEIILLKPIQAGFLVDTTAELKP
jgi:hypothetical protein